MASHEELEREVAALREELAAMRARMAVAADDSVARDRALSRRNLLRAAPIAALGAGIAALSASPATAADGDSIVIGQTNTGTTTTTLNASIGHDSAFVVSGGIATDELSAGNIASNPSGTIIGGYVYGGVPLTVSGTEFVNEFDSGSDALHVTGLGAGVGVTVDWRDEGGTAAHSAGAAVVLNTVTCDPIDVTTEGGQIKVEVTGAETAIDAMTIAYAGRGRGLYVKSTAESNLNGTVTGVNEGIGIGVWGEHRNPNTVGIGVVGVGGDKGRGAQLAGGAAQLRLVPGASSSHPGFTGKAGDFFVDSSGRLWYCKKANTSTTPAVWHQLA